LIQSIVNPATIGPIVFFVGLQVNEEAIHFMPNRHISAYVIGLFPSVYDWVTNIANRAPLLSSDFTYDSNSPGSPSWVGVLAWKRGSLLVSLLWVSMIVNVLDRQWKLASIWAIVASFFAVFGIIHVPEAGFSQFASPFWEQCSAPDVCWDFAYQWMFFVAYLMLAATFMIIFISSKFDSHIEDPIDDESRHAFDDWFADAYKYKDEKGNILDARTGALAADMAAAADDGVEKEDAEEAEKEAPAEAPAEDETADA
jgi:hypothetical protein